MEKSIKRFLAISFVIIVVSSIIVFSWMTIFMNTKTRESITDISRIYMSEINTQLNQKFTSIISLKLDQVRGIINRNPTAQTYSDEMINELIVSARVRSFTYLGFYTQDGKYTPIYGKRLDFINGNIMESLEDSGNIVAKGVDEDEEKVLLLGKRAEYNMKDGDKSIALIAGLSMEYLNTSLVLGKEDEIVYSNVIAKDGSLVLRNNKDDERNYFDIVRYDYAEYDGLDEYINDIKNAMEKNEEYSGYISSKDKQLYIYCSSIAQNKEWYFVTVMPNGVFSDNLSRLDLTRIIVSIASTLVLLLIMAFIFIHYLRLSNQLIREKEKLSEEAMRASMAKSEFLSSMSHDIRTPMNAIIGMTEIALKNILNRERVEDCLKKVKLSSKHLLGLINDVLDMSKIESGKMSLNVSVMSLKEAMEDIVNIMQPQVKQRKQYFDIFIHKVESEEIYCDGVRLNQVLLNILSNAVKFTPEEGRIDVHIYQEPSPLGETHVRTHFRIKDTGIGMSDEFQKKIFDSFTREDTEQVLNITGTGLGMAITKCIVDLMGGTIELESELGRGSEFHVTLDLVRSSVTEEDMILPAWNVLVVDDNEELCTSAVNNLKELGVNADWTVDGMEAARMVEQQHNKSNDYKFVLVDWKMPNMDGIQTVHEIRKVVKKRVPIFLISAYDWGDIEDKAREADVEGFIPKPLFKSTLYFSLSQFMNKESKTVSQQKEKEEIDLSGKSILLAEDIDLNYEIANEILTSVGLKVERAVNGKECVEKFIASELGYYNAILMDIRMPVMSGYDASKKIRELKRADKELPIIAMTADAFSDDIQRCMEYGMNAHIAKPIDIKELMRVLQSHLS